MEHRISVVIATRDRRTSLARTLLRLRSLPESPCVIVVDNGSSDGTAEFVRRDHPDAQLISINGNAGCAARNIGVQQARTPFVAFSDDDSWWDPGSLSRAADLLERHRSVALLAARVLVGASSSIDPICEAMAHSHLPRRPDTPGPSVLGFLACGAVIRSSSFLEVGGFEGRYGIGGEEELLAIDLAAAGYGLAYCDEVVAHHLPGTSGPRPGRRRLQFRNALWSAWLRRSLPFALRRTALLIALGCHDQDARNAIRDALTGVPWVFRGRRPVPLGLEKMLSQLER